VNWAPQVSGASRNPEEAPVSLVRVLPASDPARDPDRLVPLVAEAKQRGHSVLVFCATRLTCEACARLLAELLPPSAAEATGAPAHLPA
jgi:replicative superfamily II helicase